MKKYIGFIIARIGAYLWEKGGFCERYEDLKISGKLGYNLVCEGLTISGITKEDIDRLQAQIKN